MGALTYSGEVGNCFKDFGEQWQYLLQMKMNIVDDPGILVVITNWNTKHKT